LKVNTCSLDSGVKCMPFQSENDNIVFIITNNIPKLYYDLNSVSVSVQAENCSGTLVGPDVLKSGDVRNYTINCPFEKFLAGNLTFTAMSKENLKYQANGAFFLKKQ
jgi:hypothetical protein